MIQTKTVCSGDIFIIPNKTLRKIYCRLKKSPYICTRNRKETNKNRQKTKKKMTKMRQLKKKNLKEKREDLEKKISLKRKDLQVDLRKNKQCFSKNSQILCLTIFIISILDFDNKFKNDIVEYRV